MTGWIKIHREITKHWIWQDPIKLKWWLDILLMVNHAGAKVNVGMQLFECNRGQTIMSLKNWATRWNISRDTARNFLVLLEKDGMILHENIGKSTRITVCKYDSYQSELHNEQTIFKQQTSDGRTVSDTNNNDNNIKNEKKEKNNGRFHPPTIEEIRDYCLERKSNVDANRFFDFYESKGWMVGKNKMKDWKAAVRNWEKTDNNKSYVHPIANYQTSKLNQDDRW